MSQPKHEIKLASNLIGRAVEIIDWIFRSIGGSTVGEFERKKAELEQILDEADDDEKKEIQDYFDKSKKEWETKH